MAFPKPVRAVALAAIPVAVGLAAAAAFGYLHSGTSGALAGDRRAGSIQQTPRPGLSPGGSRQGSAIVAAGGGPGSPVADLFRFRPVQEFNISRLFAGPVRIDGTDYTDSMRFTCDTRSHTSSGDLDYKVAGYGALTTMIAIAPGRTGMASVSFFNDGTGIQVAGPYLVYPGHPRHVRIAFPGASQLEISCAPAGPRPGTAALALANPVLGRLGPVREPGHAAR